MSVHISVPGSHALSQPETGFANMCKTQHCESCKYCKQNWHCLPQRVITASDQKSLANSMYQMTCGNSPVLLKAMHCYHAFTGSLLTVYRITMQTTVCFRCCTNCHIVHVMCSCLLPVKPADCSCCIDSCRDILPASASSKESIDCRLWCPLACPSTLSLPFTRLSMLSLLLMPFCISTSPLPWLLPGMLILMSSALS